MMISIKKIYTFLIIFFPILSIYRSPIASIDMGTFLICITGVAIALNKKWVIELQRKLLPLILYVVIITSISIFSSFIIRSKYNCFNAHVKICHFTWYFFVLQQGLF